MKLLDELAEVVAAEATDVGGVEMLSALIGIDRSTLGRFLATHRCSTGTLDAILAYIMPDDSQPELLELEDLARRKRLSSRLHAMGGLARAAKLSAERRAEIASMGGQAKAHPEPDPRQLALIERT